MAKRAILVVFVLVLAVSFTIPRSALATEIYCDGFESYPVNTYPAPPWINMFSGVSGYVTDEQAYIGLQSYRSESYPNWARWDYVVVDIPDQVIYQAAVYLTEAGKGCAVGFGFVQPGTSNTGRWANAVHFANDGTIRFSTQTAGSTVLGSWTPGTWNEIRVRIDYTTNLASIDICYKQVGADLPTDPKTLPASVWGVEIPLNQFGMFGDNFSTGGTSVVYYDKICVYEPPPVPVENSSWGRIKSLFND
jgi:hypothetical protein